MPEWTVRLWTNADVGEFPPDVQAFIGKAEKGVQKADILRYYVLERYGGVYVDADVVPHRTLAPVLWLDQPLVICHDMPVTWPYISIGFIAAAPSHPVMQRTCALVLLATLNTNAPHFETGPRVFGEAICQHRAEAIACLPHDAFYRNEDDDARLGWHTYAKMWDL